MIAPVGFRGTVYPAIRKTPESDGLRCGSITEAISEYRKE